MCSLFMATAHRHSSHDYSLPCAQQMEFSNAKSIKSFVATGSKYTINSENVKKHIFTTEHFLIKESIAAFYLNFSLFIREELQNQGSVQKEGCFYAKSPPLPSLWKPAVRGLNEGECVSVRDVFLFSLQLCVVMIMQAMETAVKWIELCYIVL